MLSWPESNALPCSVGTIGLVNRVSSSRQTSGHRSVVRTILILLRGLMGGVLLRVLLLHLLLLVVVLYSLATAANPPYQSAHCSASGGTLACIAGDGPANCSQRRSAACAS